MTLAQYYYLVASLPMLFFADAPPFSSRSWLERCREQVAATDHALLTRIGWNAPIFRPGDHAVWQAVASWETALRNELALQRAQRLGWAPEPFLREAPFYAGMPALVKEALGAGTAKTIETALDRRRWAVLEELENGTQFDLGRLIAYRLKLLLLERHDRFRPEPGREAFEREYAQVLNQAAWANGVGPAAHTEKRHD
ncbi:MAG TPA: hypothetical protein VLQ89_06535 [Candidatus Binatia bacterium]|nr:hypothetical protein [Candidatus Binatia bacterium]